MFCAGDIDRPQCAAAIVTSTFQMAPYGEIGLNSARTRLLPIVAVALAPVLGFQAYTEYEARQRRQSLRMKRFLL